MKARAVPGPWRDPDEESIGLFPGLVVHDGRVTGSITVGQSRLPLWAFAGWDWDEVVESWDYIETDYEWTQGRHASFLHCLLQMRGEFGRLLLVLANAERLENERHDEALAPHGPVVNITPGDPNAVQLPPSWWECELADPVIEQLRRCLVALGADQ